LDLSSFNIHDFHLVLFFPGVLVGGLEHCDLRRRFSEAHILGFFDDLLEHLVSGQSCHLLSNDTSQSV